jgi:2-oxoglutarate dehydrogenase E2 component (dihydrolipoamide succinyltransferase)
MSKINITMPKMGESVAEATIIKWVKEIGDKIHVDETIVEIATDKVDSEIPSITAGTLIEKLYKEDDIVKVGEIIAIIEDSKEETTHETTTAINNIPTNTDKENKKDNRYIENQSNLQNSISQNDNTNNKFYSPLVKSIAKQENLKLKELNNILGSGKNGRVTKKDIIKYIASIQYTSSTPNIESQEPLQKIYRSNVQHDNDIEIIKMDRMRKIISKHMTASKSISAHVTSFIEVDVTRMVKWRNSIKDIYFKREGQKITYTPILFESIIKAIIDFPLINISVDHDNIIKHKNIHLGMATALDNGNLIVPVIRNAQEKNLLGITKSVNDLAIRARDNNLKPDEISGGTFTVTNVGSFGSIMGTPIINQPQVAILALGKIQKKPTVIETEDGDTIAIRSKMFLSLSYDHRVVDGALGGKFLQRVTDYIEKFDLNKEV